MRCGIGSREFKQRKTDGNIYQIQRHSELEHQRHAR